MQLSWDLSPSRLAPKLTEYALSAPQMGTVVMVVLWLRTVPSVPFGSRLGSCFLLRKTLGPRPTPGLSAWVLLPGDT